MIVNNYQILMEFIENFEIKRISLDTNFWMVRTQSGYFYNEYIKNNFIALGWNIIDSQTVFDETNNEILKDRIKSIYSNQKPTESINKSKRFMYEMKEGDYVLIPNAGSSEIAICKIGEYFEKEFSYKDELVSLQQIKNRESAIGEIKCPYKKRRHIELEMIVSNKRIGYKLLKAISSYHGLSDMREYAVDILNCVYDCYLFDDNMYIPINISKQRSITAKELSNLMYGVTNLFVELMTDESYILATANVNSPGKYVVCLKKAYETIKKGAIPLVALSIFLFGGEFAGNKMNGVIPGAISAWNDFEARDIEKEKRQEELKGERLDNYLKALEVIEKTGSLGSDINIQEVIANIGIILGVDESLELKSNKYFAQEQCEEKDILENIEETIIGDE